MTESTVENYGWHSSRQTYSTSYIAPKIKEILTPLGAKRVADLGAGNGGLCAEVAQLNVEVVGVEYDKSGVEIAKKAYPKIPFYNFGVQDNPAALLRQESKFDVVILTEVVEHLFSPASPPDLCTCGTQRPRPHRYIHAIPRLNQKSGTVAI